MGYTKFKKQLLELEENLQSADKMMKVEVKLN